MTKAQIWKKNTQEEIETKVFGASRENINYNEQVILGIPASYLDDHAFKYLFENWFHYVILLIFGEDEQRLFFKRS